MQVIRTHDYLTYAPKDAHPDAKALRRIMYSFFVALAVAFAVCMFITGRDIGVSSHPAVQRASIHSCSCKGQCIR
jgi:hypothetical protein